ncbi:MAG: HAD hydrolase family protein [Bacteroidota bacterium]
MNYPQITHVLSDVDGVLTDGGMYYTESGDEFKKFSVYDGMAFVILKENGIKTGILTAEDRQLNRRRADKLKLDYHFHGVKDKLQFMEQFCARNKVSLNDVGYLGDDRNDLELLKEVGVCACPANAIKEVKAVPNIHLLKKTGGTGALREFVNEVLGLPN